VTRTEGDMHVVSAAGMDKALRAIGDAKLNEIFGPGTAKRLREIMEATRTEDATAERGARI
jgi:hypothetical protein